MQNKAYLVELELRNYREVALMFIGTALLIVSSFFKIPFYPVSFTMHTAAIFFIGLTLSPKYAFGSVFTYLFLGSVGFPVFSGHVNTLWFLSRCGGFYLAFLIAAVIISSYRHKYSFGRLFLLGQFIIYSLGFVWLVPFLGMKNALLYGVILFIPSDAMKLYFIYFLVKRCLR